MLPAPIDHRPPRRRTRAARSFRGRLARLSILAMVAGLVAAGTSSPSVAAQATGDDVPVWSTGWSWTYQTTFRYVADGADVTLNENVTYTVAGTESVQGQSAYRLNISGTITGGSGTAAVDGVGNANLSNFSGTVSGTKLVRRSDLAMLRETQHQNLAAKASVSFISANITAAIDLDMTPTRGWRAIAFPVEAGQSWTNDVDVDYDGGFSYDAGSFGGGASSFDGTFAFEGPTAVTNATAGVPAGNIATRRVHTQSPDGQTVNTHWWAPTHRNDAQELLRLPVDGGSLTLDRKLSSSSTPAPTTTITGTISPSLTCAGGDVTVAGRLSSGAAGVAVNISLDRSPVAPGQTTTTTATTTAGGNYTATLAAPAESDGLQKTGARGSWGVLVSAAGATTAATLVVTPKNCSSLTYTGATSAAQGGTATLKATLVDKTGQSVVGRTVTFALSGGATASATTNAQGVAQAQIDVAGPPRDATVTASYAGASTLEAATTSAPFTVGAIATTTTVTADPTVVTIGAPVRFTASVTPDHGAAAAGAVQFRVDGADFGAAVPLADGSATSPALSTLGLGDHSVVAVYTGTTDHATSTSPAVSFRVREPLLATSTTSTVDPATAVYGQPVTLSAQVATASGTPTGDVVFTVGGEEVGRAGVGADGVATTEVADLPVGSNQVVAAYTGDDVYDASTAAPKSVTVGKAGVTVDLVASDTTTVAGEAVSHTATVAVTAPGGGTPDGTVQLRVDGNAVGEPVELDNGSAAFAPVTSLGAGNHTVSVAYSGSSRYSTGSAQQEQVVDQADTTVAVVASPSPSVQDQNVRFTASVAATHPGSGAPGGTVTFYAGDETLGSAPLAGTSSGSEATLDVADLAPGSYQVTARYAGDADYRGSTSPPTSHTVIEGTAVVETTTVVTSSANPSTYGELITFTAEVTATDGEPAGAVQFSVDGQDFGGPVPVGPDGTAESATLASPEPGDHTVIAAFVPEPGFTGSGDILTQTVAAAGVELDLQSSAPDSEVHEAVRFTVEVSSPATGAGTPTGFVQFSVDGRPLGDAVALEDGTAHSLLVDDLAPGQHTVTALYSGDARFESAVTGIEQTVSRVQTQTELTLPDGPVVYGDPVQLTATVSAEHEGQGAPEGVVTFRSGEEVVATATLAPGADATGTATVTVVGLGAGDHPLRAVYGGNDTFEGSSSATAELSVAKRATITAAAPAVVSLSPLGLPLGQLRAVVTAGDQPLAGAPVQFQIGTKVVCTSTTDAAGLATCNAVPQLLALILNGGYTATFGGDANHLSSTARGVILK